MCADLHKSNLKRKKKNQTYAKQKNVKFLTSKR